MKHEVKVWYFPRSLFHSRTRLMIYQSVLIMDHELKVSHLLVFIYIFVCVLLLLSLLQAVLPCLIDLLSVLEKPFGPPGSLRGPRRHDCVLRLVLTHMEMEHKLALRRIYADNLLLFVEKWVPCCSINLNPVAFISLSRSLEHLLEVLVPFTEVHFVLILQDGNRHRSAPEEAGEGDSGISGGLGRAGRESQAQRAGGFREDDTGCLAKVLSHKILLTSFLQKNFYSSCLNSTVMSVYKQNETPITSASNLHRASSTSSSNTVQ